MRFVKVFGPGINDVSSPSGLGTSAANWFTTITTPDHGQKSPAMLATSAGAWVDVRDVALSHVLALTSAAAANQRIITSAASFSFQEFLDIAAKLYPDIVKDKGVPGAGKDAVHKIQYKNEKSVEVLGLKYRTMEETTRDSIEDFKKRGWVQ
jgi:nucleoside-diphosphate-sugar epimerase